MELGDATWLTISFLGSVAAHPTVVWIDGYIDRFMLLWPSTTMAVYSEKETRRQCM